MKPALFALFLALSAPVPFAEAAAAIEEDVVVESARSGSPRRTTRSRVRRSDPVVVGVPRAATPLDASLPFRDLIVWAPRLLSRPPPQD